MKQITTVGLTVLLLAGSALAGSRLILDESHGLSEKTEVQSFDGKTKTVRVREYGVLTNRPLGDFSTPAQEKIMAWYADKAFKRSSGLRIKTEEKRELAPNGICVRHEVTLQNQSDVSLFDLQLEILVFFESNEDEKCFEREVFSKDIGPGESRIFQTRGTELRNYERKILPVDRTDFPDGSYEYDTGFTYVRIQDKLQGMLLSVTKQGHDGKPLAREVKEGRVPSSSKRKKYRLVSGTTHPKL